MLDNVFDYARHVGPVFGSEKLSFLLYSLVRIRRPNHVIELGTGTGATAFCMAQALCENDHGQLLTVDNEQAWPALSAKLPLADLGVRSPVGMGGFIAEFGDRFNISARLTYHKAELPPFPTPKGELDLLFVDYNHRPENILKILATYLPIMGASSLLVFDSAATYFPSYQLLENLDHAFAQGRVPDTLLREQSDDRRQRTIDLAQSSKIRVVHFVETDKAEQNSASAIFIDRFDILPSPDVTMRMG